MIWISSITWKSLLSGAVSRRSCRRKCIIGSHIIGFNFQLCCTVFIDRINSNRSFRKYISNQDNLVDRPVVAGVAILQHRRLIRALGPSMVSRHHLVVEREER